MHKKLTSILVSFALLLGIVLPARAAYHQTRQVDFNFTQKYAVRSVFLPLGLDDNLKFDPEEFASHDTTITVYQLTPDQVMKALVHTDHKINWDQQDLSGLPIVNSLTVSQLATNNYQIPLSGTGAWWVVANDGQKKQVALVTKSSFGSMVKNGDESLVLWSQDFALGNSDFTGTARVYNLSGSVKLLDEINFGADRLAVLPYHADADVIMVTTDTGYNLIPLGLRQISFGEESWPTESDFSIYHATRKNYVFTDKPLYKAGDTVYFKAILRDDDDGRYTINSDPVTVSIYRGWGTDHLVFARSYTPDEFGGIDGAYQIPADITYGEYHLDVSTGGSTYFAINEYVKPEYELSVSVDKKEVISGEQLFAHVTGTSFADQDMTGMEFEYCFHQGYSWDACDTWKAATFEEDGQVTLTLPTVLPTQKDERGEYGTNSISYQLRVRYSDGVSEPAEDSKSVTIYYTPFKFTEDYDYSTKYFYQGQSYTASQKIDTRRENVSVASRRVTADIKHYNQETHEVDEIISMETRTDERGNFSFLFTPSNCASRSIIYKVYDDNGNYTTGSDYISCRQHESSNADATVSVDPESEFSLSSDKDQKLTTGQTYNVTAKVGKNLIGRQYFADFGRARLDRYVTGRFASETNNNSYTIIESDYPNSYYEVSLFDRNNYLSRTSLVNLDKDYKQIKVDLSIDEQTYEPGDTVHVRIHTTNKKTGSATSASVTLWTIDKALYELASDHRNNIFDTYWYSRGHFLATYHSLQAISVYGSEMGGGGGGDVRDIFKDNAYWNPTIITDQNGEASIEFTLPDNLTTWVVTGVAVTPDTIVGESELEFQVQKQVVSRIVAPEVLRVGDVVNLGIRVTNYSDRVQTFVPVWEASEGLQTQSSFPGSLTLAAGETKVLTVPVIAIGINSNAKITAGVRNNVSTEPSDVLVKTLQILPYGYEQKVSQFSIQAGTFDLGIEPDTDLTRSTLTLSLAGDIFASLRSALDDLLTYPRGCVEQTTSKLVPVVLVRAGQLFAASDFDVDLDELTNTGIKNLAKMQNSNGGWGFWNPSDDAHAFKSAYVIRYLLQAESSATPVDSHVYSSAARYFRSHLSDLQKPDTTVTTTTTTDISVPTVSGSRAHAGASSAPTTTMSTATVTSSDDKAKGGTRASRAVASLYGLLLLDRAHPELEVWQSPSYEKTTVDHPEYYLSLIDTYDIQDVDLLAYLVLSDIMLQDQTHAYQHLTTMLANLEADVIAPAYENYARYRSVESDRALALQALVAYHRAYGGYDEEIATQVTKLLGYRRQAGWSSTYATAQAVAALAAWNELQPASQTRGTYLVQLDGQNLGIADFTTLEREKTFTIDLDTVDISAGQLTIQRTDSDDGRPLYVSLLVNQWRTSTDAPLASHHLSIDKAYVRTSSDNVSPLAPGDMVTVYIGLRNSGADQYYVNIDDYLPSNLRPLYSNNSSWASQTYTFTGFNGTLYRVPHGLTVISYQAVVTNTAEHVSAPPTYVGSMYDADFVAQTAMIDNVEITNYRPSWTYRDGETRLDDDSDDTQTSSSQINWSHLVILLAALVLALILVSAGYRFWKKRRRGGKNDSRLPPTVIGRKPDPTTDPLLMTTAYDPQAS